MADEKRHLTRIAKLLTLSTVVGLSVMLSACDGGDGISALDRETTAEDQLPAYVSTDSFDADSVRRAVEADGFTYFIAEGTPSGFCLIRTGAPDGSDHMTGCSTGTGRLGTTFIGSMSPEPRRMVLVTDGYATDDLEDEGWTKIHTNILVQ